MENNGIFRLSSFFGIFPFRRTDGVLQTCKPLVLYSLVSNTIISATHFYYTTILILYSDLNSFNIYLIAGLSAFHFLVPVSLTVNIFQNREPFVKTIQNLTSLESSFQKMGLEINKHSRSRSMLLEVLVPVLLGVMYFVGMNTGGRAIPAVGLTVTLLEMALLGAQFRFLVDTVSHFFDKGIKLLHLCTNPASREPNLRTAVRFVKKTGRLIAILRSLNSVYSKQMLVIMTNQFVAITIQLYYVYFNSTTEKEWKRVRIPGDLFMVLHRFYFVLRVSHSAAKAGSKLKEFNSLLYQLMIDDKTNEILRTDVFRLHISMKREVVFSACGLFNLDYTLVHSMIASATTYLVILIQMQ